MPVGGHPGGAVGDLQRAGAGALGAVCPAIGERRLLGRGGNTQPARPGGGPARGRASDGSAPRSVGGRGGFERTRHVAVSVATGGAPTGGRPGGSSLGPGNGRPRARRVEGPRGSTDPPVASRGGCNARTQPNRRRSGGESGPPGGHGGGRPGRRSDVVCRADHPGRLGAVAGQEGVFGPEAGSAWGGERVDRGAGRSAGPFAGRRDLQPAGASRRPISHAARLAWLSAFGRQPLTATPAQRLLHRHRALPRRGSPTRAAAAVGRDGGTDPPHRPKATQHGGDSQADGGGRSGRRGAVGPGG